MNYFDSENHLLAWNGHSILRASRRTSIFQTLDHNGICIATIFNHGTMGIDHGWSGATQNNIQGFVVLRVLPRDTTQFRLTLNT